MIERPREVGEPRHGSDFDHRMRSIAIREHVVEGRQNACLSGTRGADHDNREHPRVCLAVSGHRDYGLGERRST